MLPTIKNYEFGVICFKTKYFDLFLLRIYDCTPSPRPHQGSVGGKVGHRMQGPPQQHSHLGMTSYGKGHREGHPKSTGDFRCRTGDNKRQNVFQLFIQVRQ